MLTAVRRFAKLNESMREATVRDVMLNDKAAPIRRDLKGEDFAYELTMMLAKLAPGDTLRIHRPFMLQAGASLESVLPPPYEHTRWEDYESRDFCVRRDA